MQDDLQQNAVCDNYDQYETLDVFIYEQLQYRFDYPDPFAFIPEAQRTDFIHKFDSLKNQVDLLGFQNVLTSLETEGDISPEMNNSILELYDYIDQSTFDSQSSFDVVSQGIQNKIAIKKSDSSISCYDRKAIVAYYSYMKGVVDYFGDSYSLSPVSINQALVRDCSFWDNFKCFMTQIAINAGAGALILGLIGVGIAGPGGGIVGVATGAVIGTLVGIIEGIQAIQNGPGGPCCPSELDCTPIKGVSIKLLNCSGEAEYTAWGFGNDISSLFWTNTFGTPISATTASSSPRLSIVQDVPSTAVETTITAICSEGTIFPNGITYVNNLEALSKSITGIHLTGPDQVVGTQTDYYNLIGMFPFTNSNFISNISVTWSVTGGTIINTDQSHMAVTWFPGFAGGTVTATVTNTCPGGETKTFVIDVTTGGPII